MSELSPQNGQRIPPLARFIFTSRWLQLPLYLGLILAQCVYVYHFWVELSELIAAALGNGHALAAITESVANPHNLGNAPAAAAAAAASLPDPHAAAAVTTPLPHAARLTETTIMLVVLGLIDVVMISNLLIMVIVGGYETFVSRMHLQSHPDQPEWLSHVNATVLKVKLAMAIIGISSIHLLKTFINAAQYDSKTLIAQTGIHIVFLLSAMAIAYCDKLMTDTMVAGHNHKKH
ncbi:YqhA family protein [Massilia sp. TS11]|uniref:YqhA family protein n=1 Tax=Massilia sp. TS11 TaxID=2908003 RepID=UPI001EDC7ECE|nr:YqhA family protein [Massilia sp. TS11]MCG2586316.1 YqhA family protein [Massilia sp. TS11]